MSKSIARSLQTLQRCQPQYSQRCAYATSPYRRLDDTRYRPWQARHLRPTNHVRPFSATTTWHASQMGRVILPSGGKKASSPSFSLQKTKMQQEAVRAGLVPDDVGLLADTFILPTGRNLPSWITNFKGRWLLEKKRFKTRVAELFAAVMYRFFYIKPKPRLEWRLTPGIAKELHKEVFMAFAEGNMSGPIEKKVCEGFLEVLRRRVAQRSVNTRLRWTLHKYLSKPKRVSYRAMVIPGAKGELSTERNGIVQAVVRIHSLQSLQHVKRIQGRDKDGRLYSREITVDAHGREVPEPEPGMVPKDAKESVEYVVVQKSLRVGKEGPWKFWGNAEETTVEKVREWEKNAARQSGLGAGAGAT